MQNIRATGPLPDLRDPVKCAGFFLLSRALLTVTSFTIGL